MNEEFYRTTLSNYFNDTDINTLINKRNNNNNDNVIINNNNPYTGRRWVGGGFRHQKKQIILRPGSKKNYESTLKKFGKFKVRHFGRDAALTDTMVERYNFYLNSEESNLKYQTRVTNVRTLNKYIIVPLLNQELPRPRLGANNMRNNKPKFPHHIIVKTVLHIWRTSQKNRDNAHKIQLIYHTGVRGRELDKLTFKLKHSLYHQ